MSIADCRLPIARAMMAGAVGSRSRATVVGVSLMRGADRGRAGARPHRTPAVPQECRRDARTTIARAPGLIGNGCN